MSTVTTLIKAEEIVNQGIFKGAPIGSRFDANLISPNIAQAELRFLKTAVSPKTSGFINSAFYDDLIAEKNVNPCNYNIDLGAIVQAFPTNAAYETLWTQWLFPFLSKASVYESLDNIIIQVGSRGAFINGGGMGENIGISGLKHLKDSFMESLVGYKPFIVNFLCENKTVYPLWDDTGFCSECDDSSTSSGRTAGFVFKNKK
jgi:hypothetical protein